LTSQIEALGDEAGIVMNTGAGFASSPL